MVIDSNIVAGYGVRKTSATDGGKVSKRLFKPFLQSRHNHVLLKVPASDEQKAQAAAYLAQSLSKRTYAKKELYDWYTLNIEEWMSTDIPMDIIASYKTVGTPNRIFLDQREWAKLLEEIQAKKTFKSVSTGKANTYAVDRLPEMINLLQGKMFP